MSLKAALIARASEQLLSPARRRRREAAFEARLRRRGETPVLDYFHQADDPYSHLMLQLLPALRQRYRVHIRPWLVGPPADGAAPERQRLQDWSRRDAAALASHFHLDFPGETRAPTASRIRVAQAALAGLRTEDDFLREALDISHALWAGAPLPGPQITEIDLAAMLHEGERERERLGHYLGATLHCGGEWYWGPDRLHYLERRLQQAGHAEHGETDLLAAPPALLSDPPTDVAVGKPPALDFYLSFRSPYTYLAAERVFRLAHAYNAELRLRFVLPMVMRGLPVPRAKRFYILRDCAREAERLGLPFGRLVDPVGHPVERGYAVLYHAREQGRAEAFCSAFLRGVWSEGIDAGSDRGLRRITERAGLDWAQARAALNDDRWRAEAEQNREALLGRGLWGVPSFGVGDTLVWGQDRLWQVEAALRAGRADPQ